ncbi:beta-galactosidase 9 [Physcomitrium patens]|uniref:Beta-galactosidase n=1 Tax=Physcomitrium patens TaxID=3218 RepID=A0A2K1IIL5_PHYPA|nr:beta-galactosidase 9-like [Physcomitrium patens]XP_024362300.1 beta-galactosidase 9-like [Physcomitrium patens]PNR29115.1 hypothetical protein PHYPA_027807 [Physcomitrium patens]|eukprot:XP_024362298.1 beta-galactosidase 9-like [Physcomitrella patens]
MGNLDRSLHVFLLLLLLLSVASIVPIASARKPINVTYDQRALIINGQRRMLISAGIHYPRATPEMWPSLVQKSKEGGADVVQSYVFWNGHEPKQGQYNFEGRYDLVKFIKVVQQAGLYFHLRIGPYVCAEWNFGGFPYWLKDIPGIVFRTDNEPFKVAMEGFVSKIVNLMKENQLFAWQGGPIIMAQIENEYGNIEWAFGDGGKRYAMWAAELALGLDAGVPWVMCQQDDAPGNIINTCNGYYCDGFKANTATKPAFWTEDWNGWFQYWGQSVPHRPVEDNAFAIARFFQRGGSFQNYYMYFGGTNFARTAGGPFMTTSYDYDAPLDEYGLIRQPKWGHLRDLHAAIKLCEPALTAVDEVPLSTWLGPNVEAHVYSGRGQCAAFLANIDSWKIATVQFKGKAYVLPPWSVSILPDCKNVVFNTAQVGAQTTLTRMTIVRSKLEGEVVMPSNMLRKHAPESIVGSGLKWEASVEPVGIRGAATLVSNRLLEQLNITKDSTDYLWYSISIKVSVEAVTALSKTKSQAILVLGSMRDAVHIFVNRQLVGSAMGSDVQVVQPVPLKEGKNDIDLLSMTVGLQNYGAYLETWGAGIRGSALLRGLPSGVLDLSTERWSYQVGIQGEEKRLFETGTADGIQWDSSSSFPNASALTWYKTTFDAPKGTDPVALDLGSMGKGQAWVNGHHMGRYWPSVLASQSGCSTCDYRGAYDADKCRTNCGKPSQRWYHIPRAWLQLSNNLLVLFEEIGGDVSKVSLVTRSAPAVCTHVHESQPPPVLFWPANSSMDAMSSRSGEAVLECIAGQHIRHIKFASFGNPKGSCGNFQRGTCHAMKSLEVARKACMGMHRCSIPVQWQTFGEFDPCPDVSKSLAVQVFCSSKGSQQATDEPVPPAYYFNYQWQQPIGMNDHLYQRKVPLITPVNVNKYSSVA